MRRMRIIVLAALVLLYPLISQCPLASAQAASISIDAPQSVFIMVDGAKMYGRTFSAPIGSNITILDEVVYESGDVRYRFAFWLRDGAFLSKSPQIKLEASGDYTAVYIKEFRVAVVSEPLLFAETFWVPRSGRLNYTAPLEVKAGEMLYKFRMWEGGGAVSLNNTISTIVTGPMLIKAHYNELYPLYVAQPEGNILVGYFPAGYTHLFIGEEKDHGGEKKVLEDIIVVGGVKAKISQSAFIVAVQGKTIIIPVYTTLYRVSVETIQGVFTEWVREGEAYTLTAPQTITVGDVSYAFSEWVGGVNASAPTYTVRVNGPLNAKAVYKKMYRVSIVSPRGERAIYVEEGKPLIIYEPPEYKGLLSSRVLKAFYINDAEYKPKQPGILKIDEVRRSMAVIAAYEEQVEWVNIMFIALIPAAVIAAYISYASYERRKNASRKSSG